MSPGGRLKNEPVAATYLRPDCHRGGCTRPHVPSGQGQRRAAWGLRLNLFLGLNSIPSFVVKALSDLGMSAPVSWASAVSFMIAK